MTSDTGVTKEEEEEEDDTMQNTVVLFSNTDKFVLLQVPLCFEFVLILGCLPCLIQHPKLRNTFFLLFLQFHMNFLCYFRTCALCVAVLEKVLRGSYWLAPNAPSVTILIVSTAK